MAHIKEFDFDGVSTKSKEEVNIVKLYDTIMAQFSTM